MDSQLTPKITVRMSGQVREPDNAILTVALSPELARQLDEISQELNRRGEIITPATRTDATRFAIQKLWSFLFWRQGEEKGT